jgi:hypothetical protein
MSEDPSPSPTGSTPALWDTVRISRLLRRLALPVVLVAFLLFYLSYGWQAVPNGMDTVPESAPVGSICAIQKRPSAVQVGSLVFLELDRGGLLLSKVSAVLPGGRFLIRHENRDSAFLSYEDLGPFDVRQVRGLVLGVFRFGQQGSDDR